MEASCRRALELGLPSIAFTEHADFVAVHRSQRPLDAAGYLGSVAFCRRKFPGLRIVAGVELGEPHWFAAEVSELLEAGFERVLGSIHCIRPQGEPRDMSQGMAPEAAEELVREFFAEELRLAQSGVPFAVFAHLDYFKRYWPHEQLPFDERRFEEEYRAVLRELARREAVLEVNTTRGDDPARGLCPGPVVLAWWREEGGRALSFGSDAHEPAKIALGFEVAAAAAEAAGFRPNPDPAGYWLG
jgi:histidinol-phosphatase (PHP family)